MVGIEDGGDLLNAYAVVTRVATGMLLPEVVAVVVQMVVVGIVVDM